MTSVLPAHRSTHDRTLVIRLAAPSSVHSRLEAEGRFGNAPVTDPEWVHHYAQGALGTYDLVDARAGQSPGGGVWLEVEGRGCALVDPLTFTEEVLSIPLEGLVHGLPEAMLRAPGQAPVSVEPFEVEVSWSITLPPGFRVLHHPDDASIDLGPLSSEVAWRVEGRSVQVSARLRGQSAFLGPAEQEPMFRWLLARARPEVPLGFAPLILGEQGAFCDAIRQVDALAAAHPEERGLGAAQAMVRARAGLREAAVARLEGLAEPHRSYWEGVVLGHNLAGEDGGQGLDREGSIAAHRRAAEGGHPLGSVFLAWTLRHNAAVVLHGHGSAPEAAIEACIQADAQGHRARMDWMVEDLVAVGRYRDALKVVAEQACHMAGSPAAVFAVGQVHGLEAGWAHAQREVQSSRDLHRLFGKGWEVALRRGDYAGARAILERVHSNGRRQEGLRLGMNPLAAEECPWAPDSPEAAVVAAVEAAEPGSALADALAAPTKLYGPEAALALFRGGLEVVEREPGVGVAVRVDLLLFDRTAVWLAEEASGWRVVGAEGDGAPMLAEALRHLHGDAHAMRTWARWAVDAAEGVGFTSKGHNPVTATIGRLFGRVGLTAFESRGGMGGTSPLSRGWAAVRPGVVEEVRAFVQAFALESTTAAPPDLDGLRPALVQALAPQVFDGLVRQGQVEAAREVLDHLPTDAHLLLDIARAHGAAGRHAEALAVGREAVAMAPDDPSVSSRWVHRLLGAGVPRSEVLSDVRAGGAAMEASGTAAWDLCWWLLFGDADDHARARRWAEHAYAAGDRHHAFLHTLALGRALDGEVDGALEAMHAACVDGALDPVFAGVRARLAAVLGDASTATALVASLPEGPWTDRERLTR